MYTTLFTVAVLRIYVYMFGQICYYVYIMMVLGDLGMYRNLMEDLLEERLNEIYPSLGCCTCEICRDDILAFALNRLPNMYVVCPTGEVYSKLYVLKQQHDADVVAALTQAATMVTENPRHP